AALGPAESVARIVRPLPQGEDGRSRPARRFARAFTERYRRVPTPEAFYGYESMRSVLAAVERAAKATPDGLVTRAAVVREYFRTQPRASVLGPYAIDAVGDTSLRGWGAFGVADDGLRFLRPLGAAGASVER
ncbi:MAG TPA: hypothetical protein VK506_10660, partial [Conexibacter sp.]|nr:hypothetical protein [Conexibacter sp.]